MKTAEVGDVNWKYEASYYQISILLCPPPPPPPPGLALAVTLPLIRIYKCPTLEIRAILSRQIWFTSLHFLLEKIGSTDSEFNQFVIFYQWYFQPWYVILSPQMWTINESFLTFTGMLYVRFLTILYSITMIHDVVTELFSLPHSHYLFISNFLDWKNDIIISLLQCTLLMKEQQ